jgi:hypothetical protein
MKRNLLVAMLFLVAVTIPAQADFVTGTVDDSGDTGYFSDTAFDSQGNPGICYNDAGGGMIMYATFVGNDWQTEEVGNVGTYCSLAFDSDDNPHVAFIKPGAVLTYWNHDGEQWNEVKSWLDSKAKSGVSLALDGNDRPWVTVVRNNVEGFYFAWMRANGTWKSGLGMDISLEVAGRDTSLTEDSSGSFVAYYGQGDTVQNPFVAMWNGTKWETPGEPDPFDGDDSWDVIGFDLAMARDDDGVMHIVYTNQTTKKLKYAAVKWPNDVQRREFVGNFTQRNIGDWTDNEASLDLALDSAGQPHVCFFDKANGEFHYGRRVGGAWQIATLDEGAHVGLNCSIAVDGSDEALIAYRDGDSGSLMGVFGDMPATDDDATDDDATDDDASDDDNAGDDDLVDDDAADDDDIIDDDTGDDDDDHDGGICG